MLDTLTGLPVHALIVHGVVVLLPVMSVVTVVVAARSRWRAAALPWVIAADAAVVGMSFVATESGEKLQARLSAVMGETVAPEHAERGDVLPYFAIGLLVAATLVWLATRIGGVLVPLTVAASVVAAAGAIGWTVVAGHSGSSAVWEDVIASTDPPG